ncbi:MAG: hypothetical protein KA168_03155 [Chitinophagales bacterium]|jgi:hypothetical protein|nr:hypothetical protein [Chitinophagales bacterium]
MDIKIPQTKQFAGFLWDSSNIGCPLSATSCRLLATHGHKNPANQTVCGIFVTYSKVFAADSLQPKTCRKYVTLVF